jgi:hypothetical protein
MDLETEVKTEADSKYTNKNTQVTSLDNTNSEAIDNSETGDADINLDNTPDNTAKKSPKMKKSP